MSRTTVAATALTAIALVATGATIPSSSLGAAPTAPVAPARVAAATTSTAADEAAERATGVEQMSVRPRGRATSAAVVKVPNIVYHNGPVMTATTNVYLVWYGGWATSTTTTAQILTDFTNSLGGSPYFNINTTYTNAAKAPVTNAVVLKGSTTDAYSLGKTLTDLNVRTVVSTAITSGKLPNDVNGVYVVLSSADVKESSGFVTKYCGWHTHATISATDIKYAFVGDPSTQGLTACTPQATLSPNANPGADAMVGVLAHEIEEAVTDPNLNAWYDSTGYENADKCAWTYGSTYKTTNGATANMKLGTRDYLVQQNWKAGTTQGCALSY